MGWLNGNEPQFVVIDGGKGEDAPKGFHRGVLAGVPWDEREDRIQDELARVHRELTDPASQGEGASILEESRKKVLAQVTEESFECAPTTSLTQFLQIDGTEGLEDWASEFLSDDDLDRMDAGSLVGDELAEKVAAAIVADGKRLLERLDGQPGWMLDFLETVSRVGTIAYAEADYPAKANFVQFPPYVAIFSHEGSIFACAMHETREMLHSVNFDVVKHHSERCFEAVDIVSNMAMAYGILPLSLALEDYRRCRPDGISDGDFDRAIVTETLREDPQFSLWQLGEEEYVVEWSLSDDCETERVVEGFATDFVDRLRNGGMVPPEEAGSLIDAESEQALARIDEALVQLDADRKALLSAQTEHPRRILSEEELTGDLMRLVNDTSQYRRLVAYLDAHVPDGDEDLYFAELVTEEICAATILEGATDSSVVEDVLFGFGLAGCDGRSRERIPQELLRLATNYHDTLPRWDLNGNSTLMERERRLGRRIFFDEHGRELRPMRNDPCPCGSGKKYKQCCGRPRG